LSLDYSNRILDQKQNKIQTKHILGNFLYLTLM